ncbi:TPA: hypothetical protein N2826_004070 [Vibrio parahaemolyticus]|uniref:head processing protein n=1 Tax=Vibrio parahaemolyticus TaxID=670 RepID=UPI001121F02B|nr:head processing protein [Vibrio parahaemolyticus]MBE4286413.1 head processing protein [Vibrio parahaemolyticus]TOH19172.1 head processing protein [Vibrio parahaemolyticus]HCM0798108.1 hypothetical protein [Vibrio parahaemolyticus]HCM0883585.1 hypothetical protein [Vibrio parahaemolyticus]HCM1326802.1 hypothetical protein [Vibrio parahaemolyticus]
MRTAPKKLKQVTDRFSLFNDGRTLDANKRKYVIQSVQQMIASAKTQELLRLGEAYGYYGHAPRARANKLDIGETEVIMVKGKPVLVENVPAARTIDIKCSDDGIVEHTQEFLDTVTGRIALSLWESGAGGWSWATSGSDGRDRSFARGYHGMDYVNQPNYISLDHPSMMMESLGNDMLLESLKNNGFDGEDAEAISSHVAGGGSELDVAEQEQTIMYLESVSQELSSELAVAKQQNQMMLEAINSLPVYMTDVQRKALMNIESEGNKEVVQAMFESISGSQARTLPCGWESATISKKQNQIEKGAKDHFINFGESTRRFG